MLLVAAPLRGWPASPRPLAVATILIGWAVAQYPYILLPDLTIEEAAAGRPTLVAMLLALAVGAVVLVPALVYLYRLFQASPPEGAGEGAAAGHAAELPSVGPYG